MTESLLTAFLAFLEENKINGAYFLLQEGSHGAGRMFLMGTNYTSLTDMQVIPTIFSPKQMEYNHSILKEAQSFCDLYLDGKKIKIVKVSRDGYMEIIG